MRMTSLINSIKSRVPLIQFPVRVPWIPKLLEIEPQVATLKPAIPAPTASTAAPAQFKWTVPDTVEVFRVIPARYKRRPIDPVEIEFITNGGPQ